MKKANTHPYAGALVVYKDVDILEYYIVVADPVRDDYYYLVATGRHDDLHVHFITSEWFKGLPEPSPRSSLGIVVPPIYRSEDCRARSE